jgi:cell division protein ZapA (FtsZ GTPase activity inhibitor)
VRDERSVTTVEIAGDQYTIRSEASREYTLECARHVNETINEILSRGGLVEAHKAAILAAMALADQLLQAKRLAQDLRSELARKSSRLLSEIEEKAPSAGLASAD